MSDAGTSPQTDGFRDLRAITAAALPNGLVWRLIEFVFCNFTAANSSADSASASLLTASTSSSVLIGLGLEGWLVRDKLAIQLQSNCEGSVDQT